MTDTAPQTPASPVVEYEFTQLPGQTLSFDVSTIPAPIRMDFLKSSVRSYIVNRLNAVHSRYVKDDAVLAWSAYEAATAADPLQTLVAQPTVPKPAEPDYLEAYNRAAADLAAGTIRKQSDGPKPRKVKDPLVAIVTDVVVRAVYDTRRAADTKFSFFDAKKEVGTDGIAYLNAQIDAKVAAGADRASLEKVRDEKYVNPAKAMLGLTANKKTEGLPSIL